MENSGVPVVDFVAQFGHDVFDAVTGKDQEGNPAPVPTVAPALDTAAASDKIATAEKRVTQKRGKGVASNMLFGASGLDDTPAPSSKNILLGT